MSFYWPPCRGPSSESEWCQHHWESLLWGYITYPREVGLFINGGFLTAGVSSSFFWSLLFCIDSGDFLELCVMPKDEDILQLVSLVSILSQILSFYLFITSHFDSQIKGPHSCHSSSTTEMPLKSSLAEQILQWCSGVCSLLSYLIAVLYLGLLIRPKEHFCPQPTADATAELAQMED